jgi:hypothetical protein
VTLLVFSTFAGFFFLAVGKRLACYRNSRMNVIVGHASL